jgi:hypothetical protein
MGPRVPVCCPCDDLPSHPNLDLVAPHGPVTLVSRLDDICDRLAKKPENQEPQSYKASDQDTYISTSEDDQVIHNLRSTILKLVKSSQSK